MPFDPIEFSKDITAENPEPKSLTERLAQERPMSFGSPRSTLAQESPIPTPVPTPIPYDKFDPIAFSADIRAPESMLQRPDVEKEVEKTFIGGLSKQLKPVKDVAKQDAADFMKMFGENIRDPKLAFSRSATLAEELGKSYVRDFPPIFMGVINKLGNLAAQPPLPKILGLTGSGHIPYEQRVYSGPLAQFPLNPAQGMLDPVAGLNRANAAIQEAKFLEPAPLEEGATIFNSPAAAGQALGGGLAAVTGYGAAEYALGPIATFGLMASNSYDEQYNRAYNSEELSKLPEEERHKRARFEGMVYGTAAALAYSWGLKKILHGGRNVATKLARQAEPGMSKVAVSAAITRTLLAEASKGGIAFGGVGGFTTLLSDILAKFMHNENTPLAIAAQKAIEAGFLGATLGGLIKAGSGIVSSPARYAFLSQRVEHMNLIVERYSTLPKTEAELNRLLKEVKDERIAAIKKYVRTELAPVLKENIEKELAKVVKDDPDYKEIKSALKYVKQMEEAKAKADSDIPKEGQKSSAERGVSADENVPIGTEDIIRYDETGKEIPPEAPSTAEEGEAEKSKIPTAKEIAEKTREQLPDWVSQTTKDFLEKHGMNVGEALEDARNRRLLESDHKEKTKLSHIFSQLQRLSPTYTVPSDPRTPDRQVERIQAIGNAADATVETLKTPTGTAEAYLYPGDVRVVVPSDYTASMLEDIYSRYGRDTRVFVGDPDGSTFELSRGGQYTSHLLDRYHKGNVEMIIKTGNPALVSEVTGYVAGGTPFEASMKPIVSVYHLFGADVGLEVFREAFNKGKSLGRFFPDGLENRDVAQWVSDTHQLITEELGLKASTLPPLDPLTGIRSPEELTKFFKAQSHDKLLATYSKMTDAELQSQTELGDALAMREQIKRESAAFGDYEPPVGASKLQLSDDKVTISLEIDKKGNIIAKSGKASDEVGTVDLKKLAKVVDDAIEGKKEEPKRVRKIDKELEGMDPLQSGLYKIMKSINATVRAKKLQLRDWWSVFYGTTYNPNIDLRLLWGRMWKDIQKVGPIKGVTRRLFGRNEPTGPLKYENPNIQTDQIRTAPAQATDIIKKVEADVGWDRLTEEERFQLEALLIARGQFSFYRRSKSWEGPLTKEESAHVILHLSKNEKIRTAANKFFKHMKEQTLDMYVEHGFIDQDFYKYLKSTGGYLPIEYIKFEAEGPAIEAKRAMGSRQPIRARANVIEKLSSGLTEEQFFADPQTLFRAKVITITSLRLRNAAIKQWVKASEMAPQFQEILRQDPKTVKDVNPGLYEEVFYMEDGKAKSVWFRNDVAQALVGATHVWQGISGDLVSLVFLVGPLKEFATGKNPMIAVPFFLADSQLAFLKGYPYSSFLPLAFAQWWSDSLANAKDVAMRTGIALDASERGGIVEFLTLGQRNLPIERFYEAAGVAQLAKDAGWFGDYAERLARINVYRRVLIKETGNRDWTKATEAQKRYAAWKAVQHIDFSAGGAFFKGLDPIIAYANAGAQAHRSLMEAAWNNPLTVALTVAQSVGLAMLIRHMNWVLWPDLVKDISPFDKLNYFNPILGFIIQDRRGWKSGLYGRIKKERALTPLYELGEDYVDHLHGADVEPWDFPRIRNVATNMADYWGVGSINPTVGVFANIGGFEPTTWKSINQGEPVYPYAESTIFTDPALRETAMYMKDTYGIKWFSPDRASHVLRKIFPSSNAFVNLFARTFKMMEIMRHVSPELEERTNTLREVLMANPATGGMIRPTYPGTTDKEVSNLASLEVNTRRRLLNYEIANYVSRIREFGLTDDQRKDIIDEAFEFMLSKAEPGSDDFKNMFEHFVDLYGLHNMKHRDFIRGIRQFNVRDKAYALYEFAKAEKSPEERQRLFEEVEKAELIKKESAADFINAWNKLIRERGNPLGD